MAQGFKKDGKFHPTDQKPKGVSSATIQKMEKDHEKQVAKENFNSKSNTILEQKLAHMKKQK